MWNSGKVREQSSNFQAGTDKKRRNDSLRMHNDVIVFLVYGAECKLNRAVLHSTVYNHCVYHLLHELLKKKGGVDQEWTHFSRHHHYTTV